MLHNILIILKSIYELYLLWLFIKYWLIKGDGQKAIIYGILLLIVK